jgi:hypothetical protein
LEKSYERNFARSWLVRLRGGYREEKFRVYLRENAMGVETFLHAEPPKCE